MQNTAVPAAEEIQQPEYVIKHRYPNRAERCAAHRGKALTGSNAARRGTLTRTKQLYGPANVTLAYTKFREWLARKAAEAKAIADFEAGKPALEAA